MISCDIKKWDLWTLAKLLLNSDGRNKNRLDSAQIKAIQELREIRNVLSHTRSTNLSCVELWNSISNALIQLGKNPTYLLQIKSNWNVHLWVDHISNDRYSYFEVRREQTIQTRYL